LAQDASARGEHVEVAVWSASRNVRQIEWVSGLDPAATTLR
jgi:hypothetical protein